MGQATAKGREGKDPDRQGKSPGRRAAPHPLNRRRDGEEGLEEAEKRGHPLNCRLYAKQGGRPAH